MKKSNIVQIRNPRTKRYVKIDKGRKRIISSKKTPYKGIKRG